MIANENKDIFITKNLIDDSLRLYESEEEALKYSIKLNNRDYNHPSFYLYKAKGRQKAKWLGILRRDFGTMNFYWDRVDYERLRM